MTVTSSPPSQHGPPAAAAVMAQAASENFPVASHVLPRRERAHLHAIYGYARLVDDLGDEGDPAERPALLDWVEGELDRVYAGGDPEHPLLRRLVPTVRACAIPRDPLQRLIEANRRDQHQAAYATFDELLDYCALSAAPVGELVLRVFGLATPERITLSDRVCAGLQVTEHLQDVAEDRRRGRVYLPQDDLARAGCEDADLLATAPSPAFRTVMAVEVARARGLLAAGVPLARTLPPRPRLAVAAFVAGGRAALAALEGAGYDVLGAHPRPSRRAFAGLLARTLAGRGR
jgi:squalene synthase HpnC